MLWYVAAFVLAYVFWKYFQKLTYWKRLGAKQTSIKDTLYLSLAPFFGKHSMADMFLQSYKINPNERCLGTYQFFTPTLELRSPDLIKQIAVKDFDYFVDHQSLIPADVEPLWSRNLLALQGDKWRDIRATLSPSFTSSKMRSMFVLITECAEKFAGYFAEECSEGETKGGFVEVEMKDAFRRYANDVIASSAFGIACDSMRDKKNEFFSMGLDATDFVGFAKKLKFLVFFTSPSLFKVLGLRMFSSGVYNFFTSLVKETIKFREEKGIVRPDMIHLLMEARKGRLAYEEQSGSQQETGFATVEESQIGRSKSVAKKTEITDLDITAQAMIFFFAGFETVSTAMSFMAYELAANPDVQEKLHQEIQNALDESNGKPTYETLMKMKYLDMVVSETLRKWPPAIATDRLCVMPYTIKPEKPGDKPFSLRKGDVVVIPQYAIHRDERYWPDPDKFDPERFSEENRKGIDPYTYMPFGVGPRNCIGSRFALLEIKAVFVHLLSKLEIVAAEKMPIPMKLAKGLVVLAPENGFWIGLKPRPTN